MADPQQPDLSNVNFPWTPATYWRAGDYDGASLIAALKAQPELADYTDVANNPQSRVRLDPDANLQGYWITVPDVVAESVIDTAIAAYTVIEPEQPVDPFVTALDSIDIETLSTPADVVTALRAAYQPS